MGSRLAVLAIDCADPPALAAFWCRVLGWQVIDEDPDGVGIGPPGGGSPTLDFFAVPEPKTVKNRLHLDLRADGCTPGEELERLFALGARRVDVGQPADVTWTVLADPEGNEFCLLGTA